MEDGQPEQFRTTKSVDGIVEDLISMLVVGVSDGSFKMKFGISCWIIENQLGADISTGLIYVPDYSDD